MYVCTHIICSVGGSTAKFKSANIIIWAAQDQNAKFNDRQYFWLYGRLSFTQTVTFMHVMFFFFIRIMNVNLKAVLFLSQVYTCLLFKHSQ